MLAHVRYITGRNAAIDTGHSGKQPMLLRQYYFEFHLIKHFQFFFENVTMQYHYTWFKDIPGTSEQFFLIVRYCYKSFEQL